MGYFFATSPENAVPPKSWAMPKTHTPGSRLEKRGLRFYTSEMGKWLSRDPIGEKSFRDRYLMGKTPCERQKILQQAKKPEYLFVDNTPVCAVDPFGLAAANVKNDTGFILLVMGNYDLTKGCRKWINQNNSSYDGINASEGIHGVFTRIANGVNTAYLSRPTDVDGYWTVAAPGTGGKCRKLSGGLIGAANYTLTSANITTEGSPCTSDTFKGQFLIDGNPTWYLDNRLKKSWKDAITAGKTAGCCTQADIDSINNAITDTTAALGDFTAVE